jgi:hypothetical protein
MKFYYTAPSRVCQIPAKVRDEAGGRLRCRDGTRTRHLHARRSGVKHAALHVAGFDSGLGPKGHGPRLRQSDSQETGASRVPSLFLWGVSVCVPRQDSRAQLLLLPSHARAKWPTKPTSVQVGIWRSYPLSSSENGVWLRSGDRQEERSRGLSHRCRDTGSPAPWPLAVLPTCRVNATCLRVQLIEIRGSR